MASIPKDPGKKQVNIDQPSLNRAVTPLPKEKKTTAAVQGPFRFLQTFFSQSSKPVRPMSERRLSNELQRFSSSTSIKSNEPEEEFEKIDQKQVEHEMVQAAAQQSQKIKERATFHQLTDARKNPPDTDLRRFSTHKNKSELVFCYNVYRFGLGIVRKADQKELQRLEKNASFCFIPLVNKGKDNELGIFCVESDKEVVQQWFSDKETTMQQMSDKTYKYVERSREEYEEGSKAQAQDLERERLSSALMPFLIKGQ